MKRVRAGNITVEVHDDGKFANIHRHGGSHDRITGSLFSIPMADLADLALAVDSARGASIVRSQPVPRVCSVCSDGALDESTEIPDASSHDAP